VDRLNKMVPAGCCKCTSCGNGGLSCPHAEGVKGIPGIAGINPNIKEKILV
jgi:hypothetical protein